VSGGYYGPVAGEVEDGGVMSEAGGGLTYPDGAGDETCDSCTCCTVAGCIPSQCGEDDYGRFHCPCTSE
jgi:Rieske Fe-S protein